MVTAHDYEAYQAKNLSALKELLDNTGTRPVLFVGCGLTRRYLGAPSWMELLQAVASHIGLSSDQFSYLAQKADNDPARLGTLLIDPVHEWAWAAGKNAFPAAYFNPATEKALFIKHVVSEILKGFGPLPDEPDLKAEIDLLRASRPHAIVTTNFDLLIEELFPDYEMSSARELFPCR